MRYVLNLLSSYHKNQKPLRILWHFDISDHERLIRHCPFDKFKTRIALSNNEGVHMFSKATKASMLVGVLFSFFASNLLAAEIASDINVTRSYNEFKFTVGASLGSASYRAYADSQTAISFSGELGVLRGFGLEAAYMDLGEVGSGALQAKTNVKYFGLRGFKRLSLQFGLYGKFGIGLWDFSTKSAGNDSGANPVWGYGMEWRLTPGFNVRAGFDRIFFTAKLNNNGSISENINLFNLGLTYQFN